MSDSGIDKFMTRVSTNFGNIQIVVAVLVIAYFAFAIIK